MKISSFHPSNKNQEGEKCENNPIHNCDPKNRGRERNRDGGVGEEEEGEWRRAESKSLEED